MTLLQAAVLGVIQGLTGLLPLSSTAHLRLVPALFGWHFHYGGAASAGVGTTFSAVVQMGTALALVAYFWRELLHVVVAWVRGLYDPAVRPSLECRLGWYMLVATIPVGVLGVVLHHQRVTAARNLWVLAGALVGFGVLMWIAEHVGSGRREEEHLGRADVLAVGAAQLLMIIPGASRGAPTIAAGLFRGLDRPTAVRFSFLLSIPTVILSSGYDALHLDDKASPGAGLTGLAMLFAFVVGLLALNWFMRWVGAHRIALFVYYRLGLGALVMALLGAGVLSATG